MKKYFHVAILAFLIASQVFLPVAIPATLGYQIDLLLSQVRTASGGVLAGGHVHFYEAGTTTPKDVYTNVNKTGPVAANPYQLTANGTALLYGDGLYRIVIHTSTNVAAYDFDNVRYEDIGGLQTRITGLTGDNTGVIQGFTLGSASYTDNVRAKNVTGGDTGNISGFDNIIATKIKVPSNNALQIGTPLRETTSGTQSRGDSAVAITGTFGDNTSGDNRALGITTNIITNPVTGNRSSEGINVRPSFTLPASGNIATVEGLHIDLSGAWGPYGQLWNGGTAATVGSVHAIRVRGITLPAGASNYSALTIDAGFQGTGGNSYNIFSNGQTARNRFDGFLEVYGLTGHSIGGGPQPYYGLTINPTVTDNTGGIFGVKAVWAAGAMSPSNALNADGVYIAPNMTKKAGGSHSDFRSLTIEPPAITTDNTSTVTNVTTVRITGPGVGGVSNNHALWVTGSVRWDDNYALGGGATPTLGTIGGSGPSSAAQNQWLRVNIGGNPYFIPVWQ